VLTAFRRYTAVNAANHARCRGEVFVSSPWLIVIAALFGVLGVAQIAFKIAFAGVVLLVVVAILSVGVGYVSSHPEWLLFVALTLLAVLLVWSAISGVRALFRLWSRYRKVRVLNAEVNRQNVRLSRLESDRVLLESSGARTESETAEDLAYDAKMERFREEQRRMRARGKWK
jgi:hypothetical protein